MTNKACFILGAGLGTRMGKIGKSLPKILWPVFEKTLLELQISKAKELGYQNIYLNTHFQAEFIEDFIKDKSLKVEILFEEKLLDSGGAFHNLKNKINRDLDLSSVLFLNGDILTSISREDIARADKLLEKNKIVLISKNVTEKNIYNQIIEKNNRLSAIVKAEDSKVPYITYAGMGLINLEKLKCEKGPSRFFETVANYKNDNVGVYKPNEYEYYDFGTKEEYYKNIYKVFTNENLFNLLKKFHSIEESKINYNSKSYYSETECMINLTGEKIDMSYPDSIILKMPSGSFSGNGIYSANLYEAIPQNHQP